MIKRKSRERWKEVPNFEGVYHISSYGRVWVHSYIRVTSNGQQRSYSGHFITHNPKRGYPSVYLNHPTNRMIRRVGIHILVAEAFLGERPTSQHEVNHQDGNKKNFNVSNLEWVTHVENQLHAYRIGLRDTHCVFVEFEGVKLKLADWSRQTGVPIATMASRIKAGFTAKQILGFAPEEIKKIREMKISKGVHASARRYKDGLNSIEWAAKLNITRGAFLWRLRHYKGQEKLIYHKGTHPRLGSV